ncbi:nitroreductase [Candidatus Fermentibacteria bacterium]|nr:nitroreductase [Candidatus Fermentibacteria bacterium]
MTFAELAQLTRSVRRFHQDRKISADELLGMVDVARMAPCAANLQKLRYSIVEDRELCREIFPAVRWAGYLEDWSGPRPGERPPAYIVIQAPRKEQKYTRIDVGIAAAYLVLAAGAHGIGACMIMSFDEDVVHGAVGSPEGYHPVLLVALGHPAEEVILEDDSERIEYWRDESSRHHVPKLPLDEVIY